MDPRYAAYDKGGVPCFCCFCIDPCWRACCDPKPKPVAKPSTRPVKSTRAGLDGTNKVSGAQIPMLAFKEGSARQHTVMERA